MALSEQEELEMLRLKKQKAMSAAPAPEAPSTPAAPSEEPDSAIKDILTAPLAPLESGAHVASEAGSSVLGDIAGASIALRGFLTGEKDLDPEGAKKDIQEGLTYQPRGAGGKVTADMLDTALSIPGKLTGLVSNPVGAAIRGDSASDTTRGVLGNLAEEGINQGAGFAAAKGLKGIKALTDTKSAADAVKSSKVEGANSRVNDVRKQSADAGYVVPSSQAADKLLNHVKETVTGGGPQNQRVASVENQKITDKLAKETLNLPQDKPITVDALDAKRAQAGKVYNEVEQWKTPFKSDAQYIADQKKIQNVATQFNKFSTSAPIGNVIHKMLGDLDKAKFSPPDAVKLTQILRDESRANYSAAQTSDKASVLKNLAKAQKDGADALENMMIRNLQNGGADGAKLAKLLPVARERIAQTYTIQDALNTSTGEVDAKKLYQATQRGEMVGGKAKQAAEFAGAFPHSAQVPSKMGSHPMNVRKTLSKPFLPKGATQKPQPIKPSPTVIQALNRLSGSPNAGTAAVGIMQPKTDQNQEQQ